MWGPLWIRVAVSIFHINAGIAVEPARSNTSDTAQSILLMTSSLSHSFGFGLSLLNCLSNLLRCATCLKPIHFFPSRFITSALF